MKRFDAVKGFMDTITTELVVSSAGMISREVYAIRDRRENFYVQGSMGATLGIGIGIALNTTRDVVVLSGDGDILMGLGTLVLMSKLKLPNLELVIVDNNSYQTTGGQKTCSDAVDFTSICDHKVKVIKIDDNSGSNIGRIDIPHREITGRFRNAVCMQ